jgi:hypothetical protein
MFKIRKPPQQQYCTSCSQNLLPPHSRITFFFIMPHTLILIFFIICNHIHNINKIVYINIYYINFISYIKSIIYINLSNKPSCPLNSSELSNELSWNRLVGIKNQNPHSSRIVRQRNTAPWGEQIPSYPEKPSFIWRIDKKTFKRKWCCIDISSWCWWFIAMRVRTPNEDLGCELSTEYFDKIKELI